MHFGAFMEGLGWLHCWVIGCNCWGLVSLEEKVFDVINAEVERLKNMVTVRPGDASGERVMQKPVVPAIEDVQDQIGVQLRAVYETLISEPIPDRFLKLLEELDQRVAKSE